MSVADLVPLLPTWQAHVLAFLVGGSYVGSLYVSQNARLTYESENAVDQAKERVRRRDDPDVIRARLTAVTASTVLSCVVLCGVVYAMLDGPSKSDALSVTAELLGLRGLHGTLLPCLIAPVLYAGPLYVSYLSESLLPWQHFWGIDTLIPNRGQNGAVLQAIRNYVAAPITEEVAFRACILAVYGMSGSSRNKMIFLSPLWFGIAHVHHGWEVYTRLGRTTFAAQQAAFSVVFQTMYTTLFGFHCAFLFLRTGSLLPPMASHVFCNIMGLPDVSDAIARFPRRKLHIIAAHLLGILGYIYVLRSWTAGIHGVYWPAL
ncbi:CPBP family intramembrane metalloprotease [Phanerochaete sordida]|uniref:intramembrane prenyl-peptidase Rce1 n=1 Tax=Phanerochaete sordida TaxID=48140 RepID=A0A9P3FZF2_9APHY|nr:CPBP family intramembrane metalloprotease [Phanerochaete sordida]